MDSLFPTRDMVLSLIFFPTAVLAINIGMYLLDEQGATLRRHSDDTVTDAVLLQQFQEILSQRALVSGALAAFCIFLYSACLNESFLLATAASHLIATCAMLFLVYARNDKFLREHMRRGRSRPT